MRLTGAIWRHSPFQLESPVWLLEEIIFLCREILPHAFLTWHMVVVTLQDQGERRDDTVGGRAT